MLLTWRHRLHEAVVVVAGHLGVAVEVAAVASVATTATAAAAAKSCHKRIPLARVSRRCPSGNMTQWRSAKRQESARQNVTANVTLLGFN